jgi:hypothetical protein
MPRFFLDLPVEGNVTTDRAQRNATNASVDAGIDAERDLSRDRHERILIKMRSLCESREALASPEWRPSIERQLIGKGDSKWRSIQ